MPFLLHECNGAINVIITLITQTMSKENLLLNTLSATLIILTAMLYALLRTETTRRNRT